LIIILGIKVGAVFLSSILSHTLLPLELFFNVRLFVIEATPPGIGGDIEYLTSPLPVGGGWVVDPEFKPSSTES
jgi:hypothetical protein